MDGLVSSSAVSTNQNGSAKLAQLQMADAGTNTGEIFALASHCGYGDAVVHAAEFAVRTSRFEGVDALPCTL